MASRHRKRELIVAELHAFLAKRLSAHWCRKRRKKSRLRKMSTSIRCCCSFVAKPRALSNPRLNSFCAFPTIWRQRVDALRPTLQKSTVKYADNKARQPTSDRNKTGTIIQTKLVTWSSLLQSLMREESLHLNEAKKLHLKRGRVVLQKEHHSSDTQ